jgi:DNA-binding response OmpR family regulator
MIRLIITADDKLYDQLARRAKDEGDAAQQATNVLDGFKQAMTQPADMIIVDMSLHAADTLLETLHSREETAAIPLLAVTADGRLPVELRRLCAAVLEVGSL